MNDAALADLIAVVHAALVLFVVGGFAAVLVGAVRGWSWVRNLVFRVVHLGFAASVGLEAAFGYTCPLTTWEFELRSRAGQSPEPVSFMGRLASGVLYVDLPPWAFTVLHIGFGLIVIAGFVLAPPRFRSRTSSESNAVSPGGPEAEDPSM